MLAAYFERLVFHFHDELLLLFLSGAGVLKLGFDAVHLQLVLHDCGETAGGSRVSTVAQRTCCSRFLVQRIVDGGKKAGER